MRNDFRRLLAACLTILIANCLTHARAAEPGAENGARRWTLNTADTKLTLGVGADDSLGIHELCGPDGWNWTATASPIPLLGRTDVAGIRVTPKWTFRDAAVEEGDGRKVTITFANADPAMELKSVWHAHEGPGPVRHAMFLANKSGRPLTIYQQESLDVRVAGPGKDAGVWYIKNDASVPDKTGIYHEPLAPGYRKGLDRRGGRLYSLRGRGRGRQARHVSRLGVEHRPHRNRLRRRAGQRRDQGRQRRPVQDGPRRRRDVRGPAGVHRRVQGRPGRRRQRPAQVPLRSFHAGSPAKRPHLSQGGMERLCRDRARVREAGSPRRRSTIRSSTTSRPWGSRTW